MKISGGVSFNQTAYSAWGMESRRDPYRYILSGNLNFDVYGMAIPLSFTYSNQDFNYNQPFNQFTISPSYKWLNFQLGYGNVSFSPYTLGGHTFLGAAVSGSPNDRWDFSVMYGRLREAVIYDEENENGEPSFRRMGYGFKTEYRHKSGNIGVTLFKAKDDPSSYQSDSIPEGFLPQDNLSTSVYFGQEIVNNLTIQSEIGVSILTTNTNAEKTENKGTDWLFNSRTSTSSYWAGNFGLNYQLKTWVLGASYERIGPEYRTLGSYYANNDLETMSLNINGALFNSKVNIGGNFGTQRNNIDGENSSDMSNFNMALNLNWIVSKKVNTSFNYSNFRSYTVIRDQFEVINQSDPLHQFDTLNYTQLTDAGNLSVNWNISGSKKIIQNLNLNLNYQQTSDQQSDQAVNNANSQFWNGALGWNWGNKPLDLRLGFSANGSYSFAGNDIPSTFTAGPTISCTKGFLDKKIKARTSVSMNQSRSDNIVQSTVISWRLGTSTTLKKSHSFNLSSALMNRQRKNEAEDNSITELTVTLTYSYRFSAFNKKEEKTNLNNN
ncbi:hypothetical protein MY04_3356 [Flammeovirga sp. MY04]|uniref:hypothetical protein n=1 Tax=Flammeovirga sp. MY04 TaxID=1191459 RepID=UPI0014523EA8|nr:hypothetical protein [Flammeovirga sp. MY04]ANQ50718.2 hypothetical protein MY04_3356 [Flammeovirga sp. MY04]